MSGDQILSVDRLSMRFGGIVAVNELSFNAERRKITALIGPNGAGKTTVFNCITGFYKPTSGSMQIVQDDGHATQLERLNDFRISKLARVARTFQNIRLFPGMTALENLMVAQHNALMRASGLTFLGLIGAPSWRSAEQAAIDLARAWLDRIGLLDRADDAAGNLPYGDQRRLEIARALASRPSYMLLDEPFAGIDPIAVIEIQRIIGFLKSRGIGVLITDHNVRETLGICDHAYIISEGRVLAQGTPADIVNNADVRRVYLGEHFRM